MRRLAAGLLGVALVAGCAAPYDDDGEAVSPGPLSEVTAKAASPTPVIVDTDLDGVDLLALAFLLRHPRMRVEAVTIPATGTEPRNCACEN